MYNPVSTYRIQFHKDFNFRHFKEVIPYLVKLGIKTIYASPVFEAVPGSVHGYDCVNPLRINPELGTEDELIEMSDMLQGVGVGWLQDIVPNHMAYHINNPWLADVLQKGADSQYASYFDIDWEDGKLMCPFLGKSLEESIEEGAFKIGHYNDIAILKYYDSIFPINELSYTDLQAEYDMGRILDDINRDKDFLRKIVSQQFYRLCHWAETDEHINYRRFFLVNQLICLNIQKADVFEHCHRYIKQLVDKGVFQGLRVDHIDGLYDPTEYLIRLRKLVGEEVYIVTEKILGADEDIPRNWPVQGTTGYDFATIVNNLFTNTSNRDALKQLYETVACSNKPIQEQVWEKKAYILHTHMNGELDSLCRLFIRANSEAGKLSYEAIKETISSLLVRWPVYRNYANVHPLAKADRDVLHELLTGIKTDKPETIPVADMIWQTLTCEPVTANSHALHLYKRCMQFTGPLMAKGVEDTLMYTYNSFIAHNEVGDSPDAFGITPELFHLKMQERQQQWPMAINATATHDTKRGEDARARLNVLSDLPEKWATAVAEWNTLIAAGENIPDDNERYMIYQALLAAYPDGEFDMEAFKNRVGQYLEKALREGKLHSDWGAPDEAYERKVKDFAASLLNSSSKFYKSFQVFFKRIVDHGIVNSLSQLLLKCTCPGIPDIYQGCESLDLSFVDPDNRRPVTFESYADALNELNEDNDQPTLLWNNRRNGNIKIWLAHRLLNERANEVQVFTQGLYVPLETTGRYRDHIVAFARRYEHTWYITVVPLHIAAINTALKTDVANFDWEDTAIQLPHEAPNEWENVLTGGKGRAENNIPVNEIFKALPVALLKLQHPVSERAAGLLMSITSLPSAYGIGDIGVEAKKFADFLGRSRQKVWQLLPVTPTDKNSFFSPYSSYSCMAGYDMLIDPQWLVAQHLLDERIAQQYRLPVTPTAQYEEAIRVKDILFDEAWKHFCGDVQHWLRPQFNSFCDREAYWLDDHAMYTLLKARYDGRPWQEWPEHFKKRDKNALQEFKASEERELSKIKWLQFVFSLQWQELKTYCNSLGIKLFGDIPFYISADSVDVWVCPQIFNVDENGKLTQSAGVPPDYFTKEGQLWHMPTYKWDVLKKTNYEWWMRRLRRNLVQFDLLRIDHFRAFSEYWEVPAGEPNAIQGKWLKGPGADFFDAVCKQLGHLPFIAEDLGDQMDKVYKLREEIGLPGMKVLQFAFGDNMPRAVDAPHNYTANCVVYTGTHDNNTIKGWYRQEGGEIDRKHIEEYTGAHVTEDNVHLVLGKLAYSTVAKTAILPMQDVLGLDETARMNTPGSDKDNWLWRMLPSDINAEIEKRLREWTRFYNRL